jgi:ribosomal protein L29
MDDLQFADMKLLSKIELAEAIFETQNKLFMLRFRKASGQTYNVREIKPTKRRLAQLNTLLSLRSKDPE